MMSFKKTKKKSAAKTTKDSIPYIYVYEDGIIESEGGRFSKAYSFGDVNFEIASEQEQLRIFHAYEDLLTDVDDKTKLQVVIVNRKECDKLSFLDKVMYRPMHDGLNAKRQQMNALITDRLINGKNGLKQEKYIVLSTKSNDSLKAKATLDSMDRQITSAVQRIASTAESHPLSLEERLRCLFNLYNQDGEGVFDNVRNKDGSTAFSLKHVLKQGLDTKDVISPSGMDFTNNTSFRLGHTYCRALYLDKIPTELSTEYIHEIANVNCSSIISIIYEPIPQQKSVKMVKNQISALNAELAVQKGFALRNAYEAATDLMQDLVNRKQRAYYVTITMTVFADSKSDLDDFTKQVIAVSQSKLAPMKTLFARQEEGFNTCLPFAEPYIEEHKLCTTEAGSVFLPFTGLELEQTNGLCYGTNKISHNQVFYNRLLNKNYNGIYLGAPGFGKSAMAKLEMLQVILRSKQNYVYVIDPKGEYVSFAEKVGGQVITVSPGTATYLNPLDIDLTDTSGSDPLSTKADFMIGLVEIMQHGRLLEATEQSIIDRCVRNIFRGYIEHMAYRKSRAADEEAVPTLKDLYYELKNQPEKEAQSLAASIEMYSVGSLQIFANRTNVDTDRRTIVYDVSKLGSGSRALGLYVCLNDISNKIIENAKHNIWSWIYIDEMQYVMQSPNATKYLSKMWAMYRAMNGVPTGILQNTNDILSTTDGKDILSNSNFVLAMGLSQIDRANLGEVLGLSASEQAYITDPKPGNGLLCSGSIHIPIDNTIDKGKYPELFSLINTTGSHS